MEILSADGLPARKKKSLIWIISGVLFSLLLVFSLVYFAVSLISANRTLNHYNRTYGIKPDSTAVSFIPYSTAFAEARLGMSKVDSVSLSINLTDSLATLEMSGVVVFKAPLQGSLVSPLLLSMKPEALSNLLRKPARIVSYNATIEKEQIVVKQAPKDTTEAALDDDELPVVVRQSAFFTLILDSGVRIVVMPHNEEGRFTYIARQNLFLFRQRITTMFKGDLPHYIPIINIEVSAEDAPTLFKALPEKAQVALKL